MDVDQIPRRSVLGGLACAAGGLGLAGCGSDQPKGTSPQGEPSPTVAPAYVPFAEVQPDVPGSDGGVRPGFYDYPEQPFDRPGYPLTAVEPFSMLVQGPPPPVAPDKNEAYQAMFDVVGTNFDVTCAMYGDDYLKKFQVMVAGDQLPDMSMVMQVPRLPQLLESSFTDLTDFLTGDAIRAYPALANIPTETWKVSSVNGRIWGITQPRTPAGLVINARGDVLKKFGITDPNVELRDGADFVDLLKATTDRENNQFAMGADPTVWLMGILKVMLGAPNGWRVVDGQFVSDIESEEMEAALGEAAKIVQAGHLHPNSFSDPGQNSVWYTAGTTALYIHGFGGWGRDRRLYPEWNVGVIEVPQWDGGGPAPIHKSEAGYSDFVAFRKAEDDRIEQLLRFADYVASPFGTQQFLDVNYGVPGYNYEMVEGNPVNLPNGPGKPAVLYLGGNASAVSFGAGDAEGVDLQHAYLTKHLPTGVADASQGLYSETAVSKAATLNSQMADVQQEVMRGSQDLAAWRDFVAKWKSQVGDAIRHEYEEASQ